jgi:hypothetical protein
MAIFKRSPRLRLRELIAVSLVLGAFIAAVLVALPWLGLIITPMVRRKATLGFLIGLEIVYVLALAALPAAAVIFGTMLWRARRSGTGAKASPRGLLGRPFAERKAAMGHTAARGLLVCVSSLVAISLAEVVVGIGRARTEFVSAPARAEAELADRFAETLRERRVTEDPLRSEGRVWESPREPGVTLAVLGGSSAFGLPFDRWLSVGKIVAWQLEKAVPGQSVHVEMLAEPGATLEEQYRKLGALKRRPDALIVYSGHNEFASRIPWSRKLDYYLDEKPPPLHRLDDFAARISPVCRLIRDTADRFRVGVVPSRAMRPPLVDTPAFTPAEFAVRLDDFRRRLDAIAGYCQRIGALPILVVPPANDAGFDPNRSYLPAEASSAGREAFAREFLAARQLEATDPVRAQERYRLLLQSQPGFAETHYRLARLLANAGAWDEAYEHFVKARDYDGMPMRCLSPFQEAYREVAARHGCPLVDGQALFHAIGANGLLDDRLFMDAMHPSLLGHVTLAQGILDAICERGALGWANHEAPAPRIDIAACAAQFGLGTREWRFIAERGCMFEWGTALLRHDRSEREAKVAAFHRAIKRLASGEAPEALAMPNLGVAAGVGCAGDETRGNRGSETRRGSPRW